MGRESQYIFLRKCAGAGVGQLPEGRIVRPCRFCPPPSLKAMQLRSAFLRQKVASPHVHWSGRATRHPEVERSGIKLTPYPENCHVRFEIPAHVSAVWETTEHGD